MFVTSSVTGTLGEGLVTLQSLSNFAVSGSGTSFVPTNGKTLRLQSFSVSWTQVTPSVGANGAVNVRLRASNNGAVTAKSPMIASLTVTSPTTGSQQGATAVLDWADGIELTGTQQFGVTQQSNMVQGGFDISIVAFEY